MAVPIPEFLHHLQTYGEYPVPFIVQYVDGKPDFRVVDMDKWDRCVTESLCSICGRRLGELCYIVGGPLTGENYMFFDPPMHRECAEYSAEVCPYVSGKDRKFSDRPVTVPHDSLDALQPRNSTADLFLYKLRTKKVHPIRVDGHLLLKAERILGKKLIVAT